MQTNMEKASVYLIKSNGPMSIGETWIGACPTRHWGVVVEILQDDMEKRKVHKFDGFLDKQNKILAKNKEFNSLSDVKDALKPYQKMVLIKKQTQFSLSKALEYCKEVNESKDEYNLLTDNCQEFATELIEASTLGGESLPSTFGNIL